jgi:hypothetical protein
MVRFNGHYDGRVITPDEHVDIPVNIPLRITIEPAQQSESGYIDWKQLLDLAQQCSIEGPHDLAERHNYYAHGKQAE